jgi:hypothetical protein
MGTRNRALLTTLVAVGLMIASSCSTDGPAQRNQNAQHNANHQMMAAAGNNNVAANVNRPAAKPAEGGTIEVKSAPPGASVLLIPEDEGGAGRPKSYGSTPITLAGIAPGKYTVDIEKTGFKYYQKEIEVKRDRTVKIDARLVKQ